MILGADIGGTHARFQLVGSDGQIIKHCEYATAGYDNFDLALSAFLEPEFTSQIKAASFAVAGPVENNCAVLTNAKWRIDANSLSTTFGFPVQVINDFTATAWGTLALASDEYRVLQGGAGNLPGPRAVIGAGSGLGVGLMVNHSAQSALILPSEGGHMDFAPTNDLQIELFKFLAMHYKHVSYERVLSGNGLVELFNFFTQRDASQPSKSQREPIHAADVSALAAEHHPQATAAIELFVTVYGAYAGNIALVSLPHDGLYIAGGIAPKLADYFPQRFMQSFVNKGRFATVLETIPVYLVTYENIGLRGAVEAAKRLPMTN